MKRIVIIPVIFLNLLNFANFAENSDTKNSIGNISKLTLLKPKLPQKGKASFYSDRYSGKRTANADMYNPDLLTAAHETLPLGKKVRITNLANRKSAIVLINDRCACSKHGRIIDVSKTTAYELDFVDKGLAKVLIEAIKPLQVP